MTARYNSEAEAYAEVRRRTNAEDSDQPRATCCDYHADHPRNPGEPYWDCDDDMDDPPHRLEPPPLPVDDDR